MRILDAVVALVLAPCLIVAVDRLFHDEIAGISHHPAAAPAAPTALPPALPEHSQTRFDAGETASDSVTGGLGKETDLGRER